MKIKVMFLYDINDQVYKIYTCLSGSEKPTQFGKERYRDKDQARLKVKQILKAFPEYYTT